jgi:hypothetical protein
VDRERVCMAGLLRGGTADCGRDCPLRKRRGGLGTVKEMCQTGRNSRPEPLWSLATHVGPYETGAPTEVRPGFSGEGPYLNRLWQSLQLWFTAAAADFTPSESFSFAASASLRDEVSMSVMS